MEEIRNPLPSKEELLSCGWEEAVKTAVFKSCNSYWYVFLTKERQARAEGNTVNVTCFGFLEQITSPRLKPEDPSGPFRPRSYSVESRTSLPADLTEEQLLLLNCILFEIKEAALRARMADILWVRKRDHKAAEAAVESYLQNAEELDSDVVRSEFRESVFRALDIAASLGRNGLIFSKAKSWVEKRIRGIPKESTNEALLFLVELLHDHGLGDSLNLSTLCEQLANEAEQAGRWELARAWWNLKVRWDHRNRDEKARREVLLKIAATHEREYESCVMGHRAKTAILISAIEAYRNAGGCRNKVEELQRTLHFHQLEARNELRRSSTRFDVSDFAKQAAELVRGKPLFEAISLLCFGAKYPIEEDLREQAIKQAQEHPLLHIFRRVKLRPDGRVSGQVPSMLSEDAEEREAAILAAMSDNAANSRHYFVAAFASPCAHQIGLEHSPDAVDLREIVTQSPFVPPGRELIFARGFAAGFAQDYLISTHLLVPQLENALRHVLEISGHITTSLTPEMIQDEYGLGKLLEMEILGEVFGKEVAFDLRTLLTDRVGSNLRNRVAHGLVDQREFEGKDSFYLWWLTLRMVMSPLYDLLVPPSDTEA